VRVWLDDVREAPEGWVHVKTPEEAIDLLRSGEVKEISLDHDLGLATPEAERTGYDVLAWLEEAVATGTWRHSVPVIRVHSANPVGWRRMEQAIASIERLTYRR
jgi:Cyclic-phosphate processing Receiver domain